MLKRPLVFIVASFILGIIFMNIKRTIFYMVLLFLLCFIIFNNKFLRNYNTQFLITKEQLKKQRIVKLICIMLISFIFGYVYGNFYYEDKIQLIENIEGEEVSLSGVIIDKEENEYLIKNVYVNGKKLNGKVKIRSNNNYEVLEELSAKVVLELPGIATNFNGFNYRNYLFSKNIIATGNEIFPQNKTGNRLNFLETSSIKIRSYIKGTIENNYPKEEAQILKAIIIGENSNLEEEIREFYEEAGIIHILVVSGAHIALIIVLLRTLLNLLKFSKQYYDFILIFLIIIYIYISGAGESILRAGIMSIIILIANILGRENDNITTLFTAVGILVLYNPMIIYSIGFQLSAAGTFGIMLFAKRIKAHLLRLPDIISDSFSTAIAAQLFVTPITAYYFNSINLMGIFSGFILMPIVNLIMPLSFISLLPIISKFISKANYVLVSMFFSDVKILSYLNTLDIQVVTPSITLIVIYYLLILSWLFEKKTRNLLVSIFIVFYIVSIFFIKLEPQNLEINYIDVGHGDSIFIITPDDKTILIDTGDKFVYKNKEYNIAEKTVIPYILDKGYKDIDLMILSHLDSDHAGGTESIIEKLNVKQLIIGENSASLSRFLEIQKVCKEKSIPIILVNEGDKFNINAVEFDVLSPFVELKESENNNSIVLMMKYKGKKALFMGDLELEGEEILVKKHNIDADILKVGHHGSITSTSEELIKEVTPDISVISVGERFASIPSKEVLNRLKNSNVYQTNINGGVMVEINKKGMIKVKTAIKQ